MFLTLSILPRHSHYLKIVSFMSTRKELCKLTHWRIIECILSIKKYFSLKRGRGEGNNYLVIFCLPKV